MTPGLPARRADRFQAALERGTAGPGSAPVTDVDEAWLEVVARLRAVPPAPAPRPDFSVALRERLVAEATEAWAGARTSPDPLDRLRLAPARPRRQRRLGAALAGLALVGATGGMAAAASQSALPGETLYPLKRALEDVRTGLEDDPGVRGTTLLAQAGDRLDEVRALLEDDDVDPVVLEQTLESFASQTAEASQLKLEAYRAHGDVEDVTEVRDFAARSAEELEELEPEVPEVARPALLRAAAVVWQVDDAARQVCAGCGGPPVELAPDLAIDPASADLGPVGRAARNDQEVGGSQRAGGDGGRTTAGGGGAARPGRADGGGAVRAGGGTGSTGGTGGDDVTGRPGAGVSTDVGGDPRVSGPLRALRHQVGEGLDGLATSNDGLLGGLLEGLDGSGAAGTKDGGGKDGGGKGGTKDVGGKDRTKDGKDGRTRGSDGGVLGEVGDAVDDLLP